VDAPNVTASRGVVHPPKWMVFEPFLANFRETPKTRTT
jgi:hypothetical protein